MGGHRKGSGQQDALRKPWKNFLPGLRLHLCCWRMVPFHPCAHLCPRRYARYSSNHRYGLHLLCCLRMVVRNQVDQPPFGYEYLACVRKPGLHWACCYASGLCHTSCAANVLSGVRSLGGGIFAIPDQRHVNEPRKGTYEKTEDKAIASINEIERRILKRGTGWQDVGR